jgi:uncharacterized membrane protein YjjB (DUF3815 family)
MILLWTFIATLGFAILFECRGWAIVMSALVGTLGWAVYLGLTALGAGAGLANAAAAAMVTLSAEGGRKFFRLPAVSLLLPGLIPLVPGQAIFTAMDRAVRRDLTGAASAGYDTLVVAASLVVGVAAVTVVLHRRHGPKN